MITANQSKEIEEDSGGFNNGVVRMIMRKCNDGWDFVGNFEAGPTRKSGQGDFEEERQGMPLCTRILAAFVTFLRRRRPDIGSVAEVSAGFNRDFWLLAHAHIMTQGDKAPHVERPWRVEQVAD